MRQSREELADLFQPHAQHVHDALYAGCLAAGESNLQRLFAPDKKTLLSQVIRSETFEYLLKNPIPGFTLSRKEHRRNQALMMTHDKTHLEVRIVRLTSFTPSVNVPITGIDADPAMTKAIAELDFQFQEPSVVGISWETPDFHDGEPSGKIPLTLIRATQGTKLRDGRADAIIPLVGSSQLIPKSSFNPDLADSQFTIENEDAREL
ncbi:hypothetical protein [Corynebacterium ulcerans]|uniref:Uncharacterized protein n=1 Tax=Corynebacterium ulcerans TaxID=65058 RepID=A0ABD0BHT4_CORUL|nr:hypothetical protein [Corynebacterium ulcerans]KPH78594.1 hypothetical protein AFK72_00845 [Corynebacterium ulcerans]KPJ25197.1 hypothetical protein AOT31_00825 [Corynebacterium ulcerans]MBH5303032.1 hypothetical protein [Corynebacterium ulcerans]OIS06355.1 hypothetical protein BHG00_06240 [Corynebacterium ulcerans]BAM26373.1 hypothetical protein CULC0102_0172 [Corynebacterium ulcerans 0102]